MPASGGRSRFVALLSVTILAGCLGAAPAASPTPTTSTSSATPSTAPGFTADTSPGVAPTATGLPSPTSEAGWLSLGQAPDAVATWSPDAAHVLIGLSTPGGPPEAHVVRVFTSNGEVIDEFTAATDPLWIDDGRLLAYRLDWRQDESGTWYAETGPSGERLGIALSGRVGAGELTKIDLPLGPVLSNGRGSLAVAASDGSGEYAVWSDGTLSAARAGYPIAWSANGERLALIHASDDGPAAAGWLEVVEWPGLSTVFSSDPALRISEALFDPSGAYIAYADYIEQPAPPRQVPAFDLVLRIVDLASGEVTTFKALENGDFAWDSSGNVVVVGFDSQQATYHDRQGVVVATGKVVGPNVTASADGSTLLFYDAELDQPQLQIMRGGVLRLLGSPGTLAGPAPVLAADGSGLLAVGRLASTGGPQGPPATVLLHRL